MAQTSSASGSFRATESIFATDVLRAEHLRGPYYGLRPMSAALSSTLTTSGKAEALAQVLAHKKELDQEILSMNALLNAGARINRIPPELLGEIFLFAQSVASGPWTLFPLLIVCRHWFVVAATTPRLWCSILVASDRLDRVRTWLARSKECPISVDTAIYLRTPLIDVLKPHVHRLRELMFGVVQPEAEPHLIDFLRNHTMPMLETFTVSIDHDDSSSSDLVEFSPDRFPRLKFLGLSSLQTLPSSPIFRQITRLHLFGSLGPSFNYYHIEQMLHGCINLERLQINHLLLFDNSLGPQPRAAADRVTLTKLQYISVNSSALVIHQVLYSVIMPPTASVSLCRSPPDYPTDVGLMEGIQGLYLKIVGARCPS
ncbi:hypothetical protein C8Q80DRAFT_255054 [Daedaleopsis nitida]|nr:hypothetical protein C8Q80DRAFT_255054 [Daedaleopsis nitida]